MSETLDFLTKGGWLMAPIVLCSIVALTLFLERAWQLQRRKILPQRFIEVVSRLMQEGRMADAEALCHQQEAPVAAILGAGLRYAGRERELIKEVMEEAGQREVYYMERFTGALGAIATISPLMGLLGTVIGLIRMFQRVVSSSAGKAGEAAAGMADITLLAEGIWQALLTTAAGLTVAIPVYLGYRYLIARIDRYAVELSEVGLRAVELLSRDVDAPARPPQPTQTETPQDDAPAAPKPHHNPERDQDSDFEGLDDDLDDETDEETDEEIDEETDEEETSSTHRPRSSARARRSSGSTRKKTTRKKTRSATATEGA